MNAILFTSLFGMLVMQATPAPSYQGRQQRYFDWQTYLFDLMNNAGNSYINNWEHYLINDNETDATQSTRPVVPETLNSTRDMIQAAANGTLRPAGMENDINRTGTEGVPYGEYFDWEDFVSYIIRKLGEDATWNSYVNAIPTVVVTNRGSASDNSTGNEDTGPNANVGNPPRNPSWETSNKQVISPANSGNGNNNGNNNSDGGSHGNNLGNFGQNGGNNQGNNNKGNENQRTDKHGNDNQENSNLITSTEPASSGTNNGQGGSGTNIEPSNVGNGNGDNSGSSNGEANTGTSDGEGNSGTRNGERNSGTSNGLGNSGDGNGNGNTGSANGNQNTGDVNGNFNSGDGNGNRNSASFNGNLNSGNRNGNDNTAGLNGIANSGNDNGNNNTGGINGIGNGGSQNGNNNNGGINGNNNGGELPEGFDVQAWLAGVRENAAT